MSPPASTAVWDQAVEHHVAGRLPQAEALYRQLLAHDPANAAALHMLGVLQYQLGRGPAGLELVDRAIAIDNQVANYHGHRGLILAAIGNLDAAIGAFRRALAIEPRMPDVLNNLAGALWTKGDMPQAIDAYRQTLAVQPDLTDAWVNLGLALTSVGNYCEAVDAFQQAALLRPGDAAVAQHLASAHNNHGVGLERQGHAQQAIESFTQAISLNRDLVEAHFNLGRALACVHRHDEAIRAYQQAIALWPDMPDAHNNLGIALFSRGRLDEAIASYREELRQRPAHALASNNLGTALRTCGRTSEAVAAYRRALELAPGDAEVWNNLGSVLDSRGELEQALAAFERALELRPQFSQAENNVGNTLKNLADLDGALAAYQRAIAVQPDNQDAHSNRLYTLYFHPAYSAERIHHEHQRWNAQHAAPLRPAGVRFEHDRSPERRLRVGYIAATFRDHCQSFFTVPLWSHHDHQLVEVFAYSDATAPDAITARLRGYCDVWRNIAGLADEAVADLVRQDRIDILVDLSLHMAQNRLMVLARKPAPVQVTWLGYPGTTGLETVDYRLTDPYLDPPSGENDAFYSEKSHRLPHTFWCYDPLASEPPVNALPAIRTGQITFGCLNNFCKISDGTLRLWARAMCAVPNSRLLLLAPREARPRVLEALQSGGVDPQRVEFVDRAPRARYLAYYHRIDLGLDTFPYNGHTTTLDSMWMGVPVITLIGDAPAGRAGWSQLNNLGLEHLAATSEAGFVRLACEMVGKIDELSALRASLRDRLMHSPLADGAAFARHMEVAYRTLWQQAISR
ncbi:MAG TPA: tetratricopeptide repeat protein [Pirellulales bacterium]